MVEAPLQRFTQVYSKGQAVFQENSPGNEMFIVYTGKVDLYKESKDKRVLVASVGAGDFFGEMALIDASPRSTTAIAGEDSQLIVLDEAKFLYILRHHPHFALIVMQKLCERLRRTTEEMVHEG